MSDYILFNDADIQFIDGDRGKNYPKQADFLEEGYCLFLSAKNVTTNGFDFANRSFISAEKDNILRAGKLQHNDIVITTRGTIGNVAFYTPNIEFKNIRINSGMLILRINPNKWNIRFIYLYLTSKEFKNQIECLTSGSAVPQLPVKDIKKLKIPNLNKEQQNKIVEIIGSLDDKIQLNNETNQTLEQIAQVIFKSWFIDFDPVHSKAQALADGKDEDTANRYAMMTISGKSEDELAQMEQNSPQNFAELKVTADAFPSSFDDNGLPLGWEQEELENIAEFGNDRIDLSKIDISNYISTENMLENKQGVRIATKLPNTKTVLKFDKNHILVSNIRPYFKKIWLSDSTGGRSNDTLCFVSKNKNHTEYLYNILYQDAFFDFMMLTSKGAKMPRGDKQAILKMNIILPSDKLRSVYSETVKKFYEYISRSKKENEYLEQTRDTLLPKLLSGEVEMKGEEKI